MEAKMVTFAERSDKDEAIGLEVSSETTQAAVERQELRKRLVVRRRRWAKKRTQDSAGSRQKYATQKQLIRSAVPAQREGNIPKGPGRDSVGRGNPKVRTLRKKQRLLSKYSSGIRGRGAREETRQRMRRTSYRPARKTLRLEIERRIARSAVIWKIRPLPKRRRLYRQQNSWEGVGVGASTAIGSSAPKE
jgi:hypothetical protein